MGVVTIKKLIIILSLFTISSCTIFDDMSKDFESDTIGLKRTIKVYSMTGEQLAEYSGNNVRTEFGDNGRFLANVDGKRIQIFNASVIVEEK